MSRQPRRRLTRESNAWENSKQCIENRRLCMRELEPSRIACALSQRAEETPTGCVQLNPSEERYLRETTLRCVAAAALVACCRRLYGRGEEKLSGCFEWQTSSVRIAIRSWFAATSKPRSKRFSNSPRGETVTQSHVQEASSKCQERTCGVSAS